jgi:hypothetical protein
MKLEILAFAGLKGIYYSASATVKYFLIINQIDLIV